MTFSIRLIPGFGAAVLFLAQPCGCYELRAVVGPLEIGAIEGRWCRNASLSAVDPEQAIAAQMAGMARMAGLPAWAAASFQDDLPRIMKLPPGERMAAIQALLEHVNPGMTGGIQIPVCRHGCVPPSSCRECATRSVPEGT